MRCSLPSEIVAPPNRWKIFRRYSHFNRLRAKITKYLPASFSARFPCKRRFKCNFATAFLRKRRAKLETWLREVTRCVSSLPVQAEIWVRQFLTAKANTPPMDMSAPVVATNRVFSSSSLAPLRPTTLSDFHPVRMLGVGAYGRVVLVQHRVTRKLFAMKVISKATAIETKQRVSDDCRPFRIVIKIVTPIVSI